MRFFRFGDRILSMVTTGASKDSETMNDSK